MELIDCPDAPKAIGPYSHAVRVGNLIFCSGQTPLDPKTMQIVGTDIEQQTSRVLENLSIVLNKLSLSLRNVAKTTVYLKSMDDDFEHANVISVDQFNKIIDWTVNKGQINQSYTYDELTDFSFIK